MLKNISVDKVFKTALKNGGSFAELFFEDTNESAITVDNNKVEKTLSGNDRGVGLRVITDGNTSYGFTNDITEASLLELASKISEAIKSPSRATIIDLTKKRTERTFPIEIRPEGIPLEEKSLLLKEGNKAAWSVSNKIRQVSLTYKDTVRRIEIANSLGEFVSDEKIDTVFMALIVASDGKTIQTAYEPLGGFEGFELLKNNPPSTIARAACARVLKMLDASPAPTGVMPVVLSAEAGGTMVHEAVGHGLEADLVQGGFSIYKDKIGEMVASPLVTVIDDSTIIGKRGSFCFDDEGTPSAKNILIENGKLIQYMQSRITAEKSGEKLTGNGRRQSYRFRPIVRMTNTIIAPGKDDPQKILKDTKNGLFVKKMGGGQVNTIRGDFVFEVQEGYMIRNGEIAEPVRGAMLTGNGPDVLRTIDKVGTDLGYAIGTCGKEDQGVPVGDAQPTLRIPELVIGGTAS